MSDKTHRQKTSKTAFDPTKIQKDFPALENIQSYLDTAFIGLIPRAVGNAHKAYVEERIKMYPIQDDETILRIWLNKTDRVRIKLASFLGANEEEIAFTYCTGCGANIALNGIDWKEGDNVVTDDLEYPTAIHIINKLQDKGVEVRVASHNNGAIPMSAIEELVDHRTRALSVSHISYINGFRHDLKKLAELIHSKGGYLIVDGTQSLGTLQVDLHEEQVDFLSCSPYKWMVGPAGVGFMYIRKELIPQILPDRIGWSSTENFVLHDNLESGPLWNHAKRYEYGTLHFEGVYALDAALDYISDIGMETIEQHNLHLTNLLRERLQKVGVPLITPRESQSPITAFFIEDEVNFGKQMRKRQIFITARRWRKGMIRISPHFYNTEDDIEIFMDAYSNITK